MDSVVELSKLESSLLDAIYGVYDTFDEVDSDEFGMYRDSTVEILHKMVEIADECAYRFYDVCDGLSSLEDYHLISELLVDGVGRVYVLTGLGYYRVVNGISKDGYDGVDSFIEDSSDFKFVEEAK